MATQYAKRSFLMVVISTLLLLSLFTITYAATTVGTNFSTTGTFTQTNDSATAARFQNAAGTTTVLVVDTTSHRVGVGAAPGTTFEVQGTASASYFLTSNTLQVNGFASVAYSRFGTNTTTGGFLANANDLLISGRFEVDASAQFDKSIQIQGTASASYFLTQNTIQVGGNASAAYSRFGTNTTTSFLTNTNDLLISGRLEVDASAQFDGFALFNLGASISTNFEVTGNKRFGINAGLVTEATLEVGGAASVSGRVDFGGAASISTYLSAGAGVAGTSSFTFDNGSATTGACIKIKDNDGSGYTYLRVENGAARFSTISCR